ncbi:MAG: hypothetical protein H6622_14080 [Halobacteriovoraceae bacterium]|nr:hypothetical protein [Halobacteriovoraceae bacterium]
MSKFTSFLKDIFYHYIPFSDYFYERRFLKRIYLPETIDTSIQFKIAETENEINKCINLMIEYFEMPSRQDLVTKFNTLPSTSFIMMLENGELIATMAHHLDGAFGLPIEEVWEARHLRGLGKRIGEITTVAIKKEKRGVVQKYYFPLIKFVFQYSNQYTGVDLLIYALHEEEIEANHFYWDARLLAPTPNVYRFSPKGKRVPVFVDLTTGLNTYLADIFYNCPENKNLFNFLIDKKYDENYIFPKRNIHKAFDFVLNPLMLDDYIKMFNSSESSKLKPDDMKTIQNALFFDEYKRVLSHFVDEATCLRKEARFLVTCPVLYIEADGKSFVSEQIRIFNVSNYGMGLSILDNQILATLMNAKEIKLKIGLSQGEYATLEARPVWLGPNHNLGLRIEANTPQAWERFIDALTQDFLHSDKDIKVA